MDPDRVRFVLVEPAGPANVGAAARALKNLGFRRLAWVAPRCDPRGGEARSRAVGAADVLEAACGFDDLDAALAGASTVIGTSRRTGKHRRPHYALDGIAADLAARAAAGETAIVFGREDHGLTDAELDRCTHLVHLPAADAYPSYNLAQAVLLVAWELRRAARAGVVAAPDPLPAPHEEREAMYRHLERAFSAVGFLSRDTVTPIMRRLRRALDRAELSEEEVKLLRGVARQTLWAAARAGLVAPDAEDDSAGPDAR